MSAFWFNIVSFYAVWKLISDFDRLVKFIIFLGDCFDGCKQLSLGNKLVR